MGGFETDVVPSVTVKVFVPRCTSAPVGHDHEPNGSATVVQKVTSAASGLLTLTVIAAFGSAVPWIAGWLVLCRLALVAPLESNGASVTPAACAATAPPKTTAEIRARAATAPPNFPRRTGRVLGVRQ